MQALNPIRSVMAKEERMKQSILMADCFASLAMTGEMKGIHFN
jgi:hypothetical protein